MGEVVPFRSRLAIDIPEQSQVDPLCRDCKPNGHGGYICVGGNCSGMKALLPDLGRPSDSAP